MPAYSVHYKQANDLFIGDRMKTILNVKRFQMRHCSTDNLLQPLGYLNQCEGDSWKADRFREGKDCYCY